MKRWRPLVACLFASFLALVLATRCQAADLFVDAAVGSDANNGLAWATPKASINAALAVATTTPEPDVVSVAAGRYYETLVMPPDVALLGSFLNAGSVQDVQAHPSIVDAQRRGSVVDFGADTDACVLRGFVIRNGSTTGVGGGVRLSDSGARIELCVIEQCSAEANGGGIFVAHNVLGPPPTIQQCVIRGNVATLSAGMFINSSAPAGPTPIVVRDCIIEGNTTLSTRREDAALTIDSLTTDVLLENVIVRQNSATGAYVTGLHWRALPSKVIRNCEFSDNAGHGLLVSCHWMNDPQYWPRFELSNCTFRGNGLSDLSAFAQVLECGDITLDMERCILAGGPGDFVDSMGVLVVRNRRIIADPIADNLVPGGIPLCPANLDAVPVFATGPAGASYLSQVAAGQALDSPGVDASPALASDVGMDALTTRTDNVPDAGACDYGFHSSGRSIFGDADGLLDIRRHVAPIALPLVAQVANLPWTDAPGVLSDSSQPLVFYRVEFPDSMVYARKDLATDSVTLTF